MHLTHNQLQAVERMDAIRGYAVFDDPGVGKTRTAIEAVNRYAVRDGIKVVVVVCPAQARTVWDDRLHTSLLELCEVPFEVRSIVGERITHTFTGGGEAVNGCERLVIYVISYETLRIQNAYVTMFDRIVGYFGQYWVVLDESHKVKSHSSAQFKKCLKLCEHAHRITALSGSPRDQGNLDIWTQMRILNIVNLDEQVGEITRGKFLDRFCWHEGLDDDKEKEKYEAINAERLARIYGRYMQTTRIEDVWTLPGGTHNTIEVPLLEDTWKRYRMAIDDMVLDFRNSRHPDGVAISNSMIAMTKAAAICAGHMQHGEDSIPSSYEKVSAAIRWLKQQEHPDAYVMWTRFRHEADLLESFLRMKSIRGDIPPCDVVSIRGGQSAKERTRVHRIMSSHEPRSKSIVCVCNLQAAEHGIDMTAACKALYLSLDWSVKLYRQTMARLMRKGQERNVEWAYLIAVPPIGSAASENKDHTVDKLIHDTVVNGEKVQGISRAEWRRVIEEL